MILFVKICVYGFLKLSLVGLQEKKQQMASSFSPSNKNSSNGLSKPIIKIDQFTEEYLEPISSMVTKGFLYMNKVWSKFNLPYQQTRAVIRGKMMPSFNYSYVLLQDGELRGAMLQHDILDLINNAEMPNRLKFFDKIAEVGKILQKELNIQSIKTRGEAIYGTFGIIDPQHQNKGLAKYFWWRGLALMKYSGYKFFCCRISSPISLKLLTRFGAELKGETFLQFQNTKHKFWMVKLDLTKFSMTYKEFKKMMNQTKSTNIIRPKL